MNARNYCNATFDPDTQEPIAFAFMAIRESEEEANELASTLGMAVYPWTKKSEWLVGWDYVVGQDETPYSSIINKLWEIGQFSTGFHWIDDLIPEMKDQAVVNTFPTYAQAMDAFKALQDQRHPAAVRRH